MCGCWAVVTVCVSSVCNSCTGMSCVPPDNRSLWTCMSTSSCPRSQHFRGHCKLWWYPECFGWGLQKGILAEGSLVLPCAAPGLPAKWAEVSPVAPPVSQAWLGLLCRGATSLSCGSAWLVSGEMQQEQTCEQVWVLVSAKRRWMPPRCMSVEKVAALLA